MKTIPLGVIGMALALAGAVGYSLAPEKLWLVTLMEGAALLCLLLFAIVHFSRLKAFSSRRSTRMGANSLLMILLFVSILAIVNFLAARHSIRWDLSENQNFSLSPQTYRVLRNLPREVLVTVFTREKDPGYQSYKERLDSYRQASPKMTVEFVDPERQPKIAQNYGINRTDTAVFESAGHTVRVTSPSEVELTGALIRVSQDRQKQVLFLEGHGEPSLDDRERTGLSAAKDILLKQGYDVGTLSLLKEAAVPDQTAILIVAGPRRPVTTEEQERIHTYVEKGGHLLLLIDPDTQADLNPLLKQWGLGVGPGVLVDLQDRLAQGDLTSLLVRTFTEHEITQDLSAAVLFPLARHITFDEQAGKAWDYVPLARTSPNSWAETDIKGRVVNLDEKEDIKGPLPMAAAISPKVAPEEGKPRPAVVVIGNSTFATNAFVNFPGNSDFFLHTAAWLAEERNMMSLVPKDSALRPFTPNPLQERALLYLQVILLPTAMFVAGILVWRKRRRL
ncbi:MAG: GldG family protein [Nitrospirae bacterium]|nr:GldG family protein [Nitrospirota bacterium]